jgi:hypothetical protein
MATLASIGAKHGYVLHLEDIVELNERELALKFTYISPAPSILASTSGNFHGRVPLKTFRSFCNKKAPLLLVQCCCDNGSFEHLHNWSYPWPMLSY